MMDESVMRRAAEVVLSAPIVPSVHDTHEYRSAAATLCEMAGAEAWRVDEVRPGLRRLEMLRPGNGCVVGERLQNGSVVMTVWARRDREGLWGIIPPDRAMALMR